MLIFTEKKQDYRLFKSGMKRLLKCDNRRLQNRMISYLRNGMIGYLKVGLFKEWDDRIFKSGVIVYFERG
jgi:hypothetical protein